ncbi:ADP-heptose:LPS heptosyltransferase [Desulfonatronum thiosulfatophilum]|uniref:ADP-heptose:LPS heptosyltransferase n=1 Tax=Desulfonatronum thiosulfatophilum TaxID=617002 RepID=A0A1G6DAP0_9BACT|nr:glycosyltransferase family 9 protein [Desulfonatronum thiosulfatophilum]SDB42244.1 ADP-heptose:LPS heptosyltransferase [Desulfonatronum thiosulfatophilum]
MSTDSTILLIHRGGLGDFLMAWPAMWNICVRFSNSRIYWIGPQSRLHWLRPLGVQPSPRDLQQVFDSLFGREDWPEEFGETRIFWFVLDAHPPVPDHPNLHILPGIPPETEEQKIDIPLIPPRESYLQHLDRLGIHGDGSWQAAWRDLFGRRSGQAIPGNGVLLFPGAGHVIKQWSVVQFFELADWLEKQGRVVRFVLGPAETDRGMDIRDFPVICPNTLEELQNLLQHAEFVVGNDSGPMHLAGMLGVPGVVLFGPASEKQWGPPGLRPVGLDLSCRPCTLAGRITCGNPACMQGITQDMVRREIERLWKF